MKSYVRQRAGSLFVSLLVGGLVFASASPAFALSPCENSPPPGGTVTTWTTVNSPALPASTINKTATSDYLAVGFDVSGTVYACGGMGPQINLMVSGNSYPNGGVQKEVTISDCPGDFSVPAGCSATIDSGSYTFTNSGCSKLDFDTMTSSSPHQVYINVRPVSPATMAAFTVTPTTGASCTISSAHTYYDGSQLNVPTTMGDVASVGTTNIIAAEFSPIRNSSPPTQVCPAGSYYQLKLERSFPSMTTGFSSMDVVVSPTPFDMTGPAGSSGCKVTVPMTEEYKTITLVGGRDVTSDVCSSVYDPFLYTYSTVCTSPPVLTNYDMVSNSTVMTGLCNLNTNFYMNEFGNWVRPIFYVNSASAGVNPSSIKVTGQCVTAATFANSLLPPVPTTTVGLPAGCSPDPVPVVDLNGLGDGTTVNKTGMMSATHKSFAFIAPSAAAPHTCGFMFDFDRDSASYTGTGNPMHEVTISTCPNTFTVPSGKEQCHFFMNRAENLVMNAPNLTGECDYPPGTPLYVNIRPWPDTKGGMGAVQFTSSWRDGMCTPKPPLVTPSYPYTPATAVPPIPVTIAGCDADILSGMRDAGQATFGYLDVLMGSVIKPPQSAMSMSCMRNLFNVWDTDLVGTVAGAIASYFSFISLPGITLTESSSFKPILAAINSMLSSQLGNLVCTDLWKNVAASMTSVSIQSDGSFNMGSTPSISFSAGSGTISIP